MTMPNIAPEYLLLLFSQQQWRRPLAIYYILQGKRTVSNLYAGLAYQLLSLYQFLPQLQLADYQRQLKVLVQRGWLVAQDKKMKKTVQGQQHEQEWRQQQLLPTGIDSLHFPKANHYTARLFLATQVISELGYQNRQYYPLMVPERDRIAVKQWLFGQNKATLVATFAQDWQHFLTQLAPQDATFMSFFLSGHAVDRLTIEQVAIRQQTTSFAIFLRQQALIYRLLRQAAQLPMFASLWQPMAPTSILSHSAAQTYQAVLQGTSLQALQQRRHLKASTLTEHLLEAAILMPDFPFDAFFSVDQQQVLADQFQNCPIDQWQFQQLGQSLPFFQFRLYQIQQRRRQHG
ncbi:hypothetical protein FC07_GL000811 [Loigolactobacillus bifermentans DSM 20003]|uniref:Helicase Helix-turn-helix domain-containing protein n=2 Tax=Loigolactobacillus bifermentans TaxID=1607 RepID=A0A0R1GJK6_9LACO|nr:hypothetical protein FC07_GL000811 [Loigolactobacillus bifermentans DSM 20003]QGG59357.1 hypothetical protein LB003_02115 [Loigolactobacillus bifermentans]